MNDTKQNDLAAIATRLAVAGGIMLVLFTGILVSSIFFLPVRVELMVLIFTLCAFGIAASALLYLGRGIRLRRTLKQDLHAQQVSGSALLHGLDFSAEVNGVKYYCMVPQRKIRRNKKYPAAVWQNIESSLENGNHVTLTVLGRFIIDVGAVKK